MGVRISIKYNPETKESFIECYGRYMDTSRIKGLDISEWAFPFVRNNNRWFGLYDELNAFYGVESFSVMFYGSDEEMSFIKKAFEGKPVNVVGLNNKVIILYDSTNLTTKVTINGKIFDTSKLNNRSIDEWVKPFSFRDVQWRGIFAEIEDFLGINSYSIQFVGKTDDMNVLISNCPKNINISYRAPAAPKKAAAPVNTQATPQVSNNTQVQNNQAPQLQFVDYFTSKKGFKQLLSEIKQEYLQLKVQEANLHLFGVISCITYVVSAIICLIDYFTAISFGSLYNLFLVIDWIETLSFIAVIVFGVFTMLKGKKKLALCIFSVLIIFVGLKFMIETIYDQISYHEDAKEMDEYFDAFDDMLDDIDEEKSKANEAMQSMN